MKILKFAISGIFLVSTTLSPSVIFADAVKVTAAAATASQPTPTATTTSSGVNDSANSAQDANAGGSKSSSMMGTLLTAAGTTMIAVGTAKEDGGMIASGVVLVGMGMQSFAQAKADKAASTAAGITGDLSDAYSDTYSNSGGLVDTSAEAVAADKATQALESAGILNAKTGAITAGGKTYTKKDLSSASSMAAAGIPSGAIAGASAYAEKEAQKIAAKTEKVKLGALTTANGYVDGGSSAGGGGGGAGAYPGGSGADGAGMGSGTGSGSGAAREPTNLAGMQKNYNGEPIGVSADSIFNMMTRRYKVKDSQESFFSDTDLSLKK